ncbi:Radical SAM domain heme biosynthesis protein [Labilithrix luteola]|uniref:Radical SAM domain heme biosynthesis protein n=1 Tax=Labilithrix luteola TaxID=1391654 RepID=A0A0K1Q5S0_9BACT|nr:radical SAM protein [Labilithrix luteola]AKV01176.1 Radical SAM domain heme biosynthesis protein [Labilithrix luteola]
MIVRYESWGAWVKLERQPALIALDREGVRALGLDGGSVWTSPASVSTAPIEVHLAVTSRCAAGCEGCYLDARPDGVEPAREVIERALDGLQKAGVFTVAFGGGEPTLRDDLGALADAARARGITPVVTTSGIGLGKKKIENLRAFAQVNVSYDGPDEAYADVRGFEGAHVAESAIQRLREAGIEVGVNVVLTRSTFGRLSETVRRAVALGAKEVQLLRYKPQGRARSLDYFAKRLTPEQSDSLGSVLRSLAAEHDDRVRIRIDCALVPFLSADPELYDTPERLARWGIFGCEAGSNLAATRVDGHVSPCSFAAPTSLHIEKLAGGWRDEPGFASFRRHADAPPEPCASCNIRSVCRGGCKVVTEYLDGSFGADRECPRVRKTGPS